MNARKDSQTDAVLHAYFATKRYQAALEAGHQSVHSDSAGAAGTKQSDRPAEAGKDHRREAIGRVIIRTPIGGDPADSGVIVGFAPEDPKGLPAFYSQLSDHDLRSVLQHISAASAGDFSGEAAHGAAPVVTMEQKRRTYYRATGIEPPDWRYRGYQPTPHERCTVKVHGEPTITARIAR